MAIIVREKATQKYLRSPHRLAEIELWDWSKDQAQAHHFANRAEAKALLRSFPFTHVKISDYSFITLN